MRENCAFKFYKNTYRPNLQQQKKEAEASFSNESEDSVMT